MTWPTRNSRPDGLFGVQSEDQSGAPPGSPSGAPSIGGESQDVSAGRAPMRGRLRLVIVVLYFAGLALAVRGLFMLEDDGLLPWYLVLCAVFFSLYSLLWVRPDLCRPMLHLVFVLQCLTVVGLLALDANLDFVTAFFILLSYQAAVVLAGPVRWIWVAVLVALTGVSLMYFRGPAEGLGLGLTNMALALALPALAVASQDVEEARIKSGRMVAELEATHRQLEKYAAEVGELATLEERNRLARELHDSVSQSMFGIQLATRSAQIMLEKEPEAVPAQLAQLQQLTHEALVRMRGLISELRPKAE
jgi:signal transduction histidine kinase